VRLPSVGVAASDDAALVVGDRFWNTHRLDALRRLDHLPRAVEEDRDPFADSSAGLSHERKITPSLGGRTVFDDRGSKKPAALPHLCYACVPYV
jgi:hypothetical protein